MMQKLMGLPMLASEHGKTVDDLIIYVHWLMIVLFIGWVGYFLYALVRFHRSRNPKADYVGVKNHASNYIEAAVALVEAVLLIFVAVPLWAKTVDIPPDRKVATEIFIVGQQFQWNGRYAGKDGVFGKQQMSAVTAENPFGVDPNDPQGKDDVTVLNEMHVPVNK